MIIVQGIVLVITLALGIGLLCVVASILLVPILFGMFK